LNLELNKKKIHTINKIKINTTIIKILNQKLGFICGIRYYCLPKFNLWMLLLLLFFTVLIIKTSPAIASQTEIIIIKIIKTLWFEQNKINIIYKKTNTSKKIIISNIFFFNIKPISPTSITKIIILGR